MSDLEINAKDIDSTLDRFVEVSTKKWGSKSYALGFMQGYLQTLILNLPNKQRLEIIRHFVEHTQKMEADK